MGIKPPPVEELARIASTYGFDIGFDRLDSFRAVIEQTLGSYARLDELVEPALPVKYPRCPDRKSVV
jgi:amidase